MKNTMYDIEAKLNASAKNRSTSPKPKIFFGDVFSLYFAYPYIIINRKNTTDRLINTLTTNNSNSVLKKNNIPETAPTIGNKNQ